LRGISIAFLDFQPGSSLQWSKNFMNKVNQLSDVDTFDEDEVMLQVRPRASTPVTLLVPDDVLASLQQMAIDREMSLDGLLKLYIGKGLRVDRSQK